MLNSELQLNLNEQKILPILNTTTLSNDIDRLSKYLEKNRAIRYIEITLRENQSFDIALELKKHFTEHKFGLGSVLTKEDFIKGQDHNFHFFVSPGIVDEILEINNLSSRVSSNQDGSPLIVSGSLINQENYIRKVPSVTVIIESDDRTVLMRKNIKFNNEFFDYLEIKDFEVKFDSFPENASNIFVEIVE